MADFVNVRAKAGTTEGDRLAKRYGVRAYPTCWVVDTDGVEIDEVNGHDPKTFEDDVRRVLRGEETLRSLRDRVRGNPDDLDARLGLAGKLLYARPKEAIELAERVLAREGLDDERAADAWATFGIAAYEAKRTGDAMRAFERLVERYPTTKTVRRGAGFWSQFFDSDPERALAFDTAVRRLPREPGDPSPDEHDLVSLHRRVAAASLRRSGAAACDDPEALLRLARLALDGQLDVPEAIGWARRAVDGLGRRADALDALARLLFRRDDRPSSRPLFGLLPLFTDLDEAIRIEEEALRVAEPAAKPAIEETLAQMRAVAHVRARRKRAEGAGRGADSAEAEPRPR
jgi:tetratricopeptide (TPR) repeat protein